MSDLIIIEASGKIPRLRSACSAIGIAPEIVATKGRFLDLPKDEYAISAEFAPEKLVPVDFQVFRYISARVVVSDNIFVLTDPDVEGDFIAWQIQHAFPEANLLRGALYEMSSEGLTQCLDSAAPMQAAEAGAGYYRRILDRAIGYSLSESDGKRRPIGRVLSPLTSHLRHVDVVVGHINFCVAADEGVFTGAIPYRRSQIQYVEDNVNELLELDERSLDLEVGDFKLTPAKSREYSGIVFNDLVTNAATILNESPLDVADAAQALYEEGCVSYTRTSSGGSCGTRAQTILNMLCDEHGLPCITIKQNPSEAHGPIIPLAGAGYYDDFNEGALLKERLYTWIVKESVSRALQWESEITFSATLSLNSPRNRAIDQIVRDLSGHQLNLLSRTLRPVNQDRIMSVDSRIPALPIANSILKTGKAINVVKYTKEQLVANEMVRLNLGHPGSLRKHIFNISKRVKDDLQVTAGGVSEVHHVRERAPKLEDASLCASVERMLLDKPSAEALTVAMTKLAIRNPLPTKGPEPSPTISP